MKFRNQDKKYSSPCIPELGYLRLRQIIGDSKSDPPVPAILPICASSWWAGVKSGRYPAPIKLGPNTTAWSIISIRALIDQLNSGEMEA